MDLLFLGLGYLVWSAACGRYLIATDGHDPEVDPPVWFILLVSGLLVPVAAVWALIREFRK